MPDKTIRCLVPGCSNTFTWSESEQDYYAEKGYYEPKRCPTCRVAKRQSSERRAIGKETVKAKPAGKFHNVVETREDYKSEARYLTSKLVEAMKAGEKVEVIEYLARQSAHAGIYALSLFG